MINLPLKNQQRRRALSLSTHLLMPDTKEEEETGDREPECSEALSEQRSGMEVQEEAEARTVRLSDGNLMPLLGLGTWKPSKLPRASMQGAVEAAIAAGFRHIDTAFGYDNEAEVGRALQAMTRQGVIRRQDVFVVSKLWMTHHAAEDIPKCLEKSLEDLQLDYLDLYLMHCPVGLKRVEDQKFPVKDGQLQTSDVDYVEVWRGMEALRASGRVRSIGVSNFSVLQLQRLLALCRVPPAVNQVELHPYLLQTELTTFCRSNDVALVAYSPLGSPARPQEMIRGDTDPKGLQEEPVVVDIARRLRRSPALVLLRFHVQQKTAVIPKSDKSHHILENTKVFDFRLSEDDMQALRSLDRGWRAFTLPEAKSHPYYPFH